MNPFSRRRFDRWHEQFLLSRFFLLSLGWGITVVIPYVSLWSLHDALASDSGRQTAFFISTLAYFFTYVGLLVIQNRFPGVRAVGFIAPKILIVYGTFSLLTFMFHAEVSRYMLISSAGCAMLWMHLQYILTYKYMRLKFAIVPAGRYTDEILDLNTVNTRVLEKFDLDGVRYDGVVADFEAIDSVTQRFLTHCALNKTPVYDAKDIYEALTGRVKIHRMSENNMGSLLPSPMYQVTKRLMDIFIVLITAPISLFAGLITAFLIKLESPGPVIYTQTRIGEGGKAFTIYKFRSMRFDREAPEQFAGESDPRITRVGRVIRKLRIDEFPQFINVLKGEMSLIGPRPEQPSFVAEYDEKIPFYNYRHIVKPGITGWAQVRHGYTASSDETRVKIEHDFYYIKNCSFSLDLIIIFLTIRIMLNGFGAR